jgi:hypothetical protein
LLASTVAVKAINIDRETVDHFTLEDDRRGVMRADR